MTYSDFLDALDSPHRRGQLYLKQFDVLSSVPALASHFRWSDFFSWRTMGVAFLWVGPADAVTGLHSDDENNILCQLHGHKRVVLYPPSQRSVLYVNGKYDSGTECCDVNPEAPDFQRHPRFKAGAAKVADLGPGDVLYVPRFWFHYVRSLDTSVSVNYFASTPWEMVREGVVRLVFYILHMAGLYKPDNCVCHEPRR